MAFPPFQNISNWPHPVRKRERRYHLVHSNPQIAGGKNIDALLGKEGGAEVTGHQP